MQSSNTSISGPLPEGKKKSGLINDWENIVAYWEAAQPQENFAMFFFI